MGNEQIKPTIAHSSEWIFLKEIKAHPLYGHIKVYKGPNDQLQCLKTVIVEESQYKEQMESLKKMIVFDVLSQNQPNCQSLVSVNRLETQKEEEFCSNYVKIYLTADYSEQPVKSVTEIKRFMISVLTALDTMDTKNINNCQFCLGKVLQFGDKIKVVNTQLFTEISDYEALYMNEVSKDDWMVAPEVMNSLRINSPPQFNSQQATVFSFGMSLLTLLTGVHPKDAQIYNYKSLQLNDNFDNYVSSIDQVQISNNIKQIIKDSLQFKATNRPTFKQILSLLRQVEIPLQVSQIKEETQNLQFNPCFEDVKKVLSDSTVNKNLNFHSSPTKSEKQQLTETQQSGQFRKSKQIYNLENTQNARQSLKTPIPASKNKKPEKIVQKVKSPTKKPKMLRANHR